MLCSGLSYLLALVVCLAPVAGLVPQTPLNNAAMAAPIMHTGDSGAVVAKFVAPEKIKLELQGATVTIELNERASAAILQAAQGTGGKSRVYLTVQGIEYQQNPGAGYEIYLNAHGNTVLQSSESAGVLHFYGLREAAQASGQPAQAEFDVTDAIRQLHKTSHWNNHQLKVTFMRRAPLSPSGHEDTSQSSASVPTFRALEIRVQ